MRDVELDERVTALEENDGGGDPTNGKHYLFILMTPVLYNSLFGYSLVKKLLKMTHFHHKDKSLFTFLFYFIILQSSWFYVLVTIAFHTVLTSVPTISYGSTVLFDKVLLNQGEG